MATRKKQAKSKAKKKAPVKKAVKKLARKKTSSRKKPVKARKKSSAQKAAVKTSLASRNRGSKKKKAPKKKSRPAAPQAAEKSVRVDKSASTREGLRSRSGGQSGDLQGLSNHAGADSESVDELLEEGNAFEADVVKGVEDAGDSGEVHTHEVLEDDVPGEYLDEE